jgi:hypothetical protein
VAILIVEETRRWRDELRLREVEVAAPRAPKTLCGHVVRTRRQLRHVVGAKNKADARRRRAQRNTSGCLRLLADSTA